MNRMLKPRFLLTSPTPLPFSWISLIATNIGAFLVTLYLAYKPYDAQLTSIRHSLLLWIVIGVVAALRGTFLQAVASTFTVETVSILTFFLGGRSPYTSGLSLGAVIAFWITITVAAALILAAAVNLCFSTSKWVSASSTGFLVGLSIGDGLSSLAGWPLDTGVDLADALRLLITPSVYTGLLWCVWCICITVSVYHERILAMTSWIISAPIGASLAISPDLVLHVVLH
jgi:hypothetical protein